MTDISQLRFSDVVFAQEADEVATENTEVAENVTTETSTDQEVQQTTNTEVPAEELWLAEALIEKSISKIVADEPQKVTTEVAEATKESDETVETIPDSIKQTEIDEFIAEHAKKFEEQEKITISPEAAAEVARVMKYWHPILDETKSELDRYMAAYDAIHIKYTKALEQIEDLKFENKRSKDIDDDVRYMSRLKKENSEDYADTLIAETAKTFSVSELELKKQLKEKRAIALQNLSGITEWAVVVEEEEESQEPVIFEGFKIK
jgi:hypothetical protein